MALPEVFGCIVRNEQILILASVMGADFALAFVLIVAERLATACSSCLVLTHEKEENEEEEGEKVGETHRARYDWQSVEWVKVVRS